MPAFKDYSGKKIGRVNVLSLAWSSGDITSEGKIKGQSGWNCKCDCGTQFICWSISFKRGSKFECKNCWNERKRGVDITGKRYGRWTVISRVIDHNNKTKWQCKCDCGNYGFVSRNVLGKKGKSQSCGCLGRKQKSKYVNPSLYPPAHGLSTCKFYSIKTPLIHKCYNEKHPTFKQFGAKGITVCDLWRNGVKDMHEWAIENGWEDGDILVLKENEKEFNPTSTIILKNFEYRSSIGQKGGEQITFKGETHSITKWAEIMNVNRTSLTNKLKNCPSIEEVFNSKFRKFIFKYDSDLEKKICDLYLSGKTQIEISRIVKINAETLRYQLLKNGIQLRKDEMKRYKRPEIDDHEIKRLYDQGVSMNGIATKLGCSFPTIKRRVNKIFTGMSIE